MLRPSRVVLPALAALLAAPPGLMACSCLGPFPLEQQVASASVVFTGRVTAIQPSGDGSYVTVTLTPLLRWKGGLDPTVTVATGLNEANCGFLFEVGYEYLVFAWTSSTPAPLFTHSCSRTAPANGNQDIPNLGAPLTPTPVRATSWGGVKRVWR